ncbi:MAG: hypothetical protein A3A44_01325 [Candidatus Sungbacteria bacterium RIFCSPLOWO2_01_FULL_60_25]|uniref:Uncharacterized protein n=1 Tax=Candidatus Sungbacteria bacterium RIFCSPLOWO2_01_FULL_60_25 TaxID=1802281 RepID=A0A1G2LDJ0_9BACT|nr:MAG: hypothetical protein A3A44_01325 [Candidatus Sungbacteria bacterium RIFCSPLOWO2_01_FULL_60_25]
MDGAPAASTILPRRDPAILQIAPAKIQRLIMYVGAIVGAADELHLDAGAFLESDFTATPPDQLTRRGRLKRWGQLHVVRSLVHAASHNLRHAAARLDAEYQLLEEQLCALEKQERPSRVRPATASKA